MDDSRNAQMLLRLARQDLAVMLAIKDAKTVEDRSFGFHAQQAVEKALKAWLSALAIPYPYTHSLEALLLMLSDRVGADSINPFVDLDYLDPFAVQLRYATDEGLERLDREAVIRDVDELLVYVQEVLDAAH